MHTLIVYYTFHIHSGTQAFHIFGPIFAGKFYPDRNTLFHLHKIACGIIWFLNRESHRPAEKA